MQMQSTLITEADQKASALFFKHIEAYFKKNNNGSNPENAEVVKNNLNNQQDQPAALDDANTSWLKLLESKNQEIKKLQEEVAKLQKENANLKSSIQPAPLNKEPQNNEKDFNNMSKSIYQPSTHALTHSQSLSPSKRGPTKFTQKILQSTAKILTATINMEAYFIEEVQEDKQSPKCIQKLLVFSPNAQEQLNLAEYKFADNIIHMAYSVGDQMVYFNLIISDKSDKSYDYKKFTKQTKINKGILLEFS